jgi:hypothetical protein
VDLRYYFHLNSTGKERDTETGLDYFGARYYSAAQGRFTSPDPLNWLQWQLSNGPSFKTATDLMSAREGKVGNSEDFRDRLSNPQSLNLFPYVRNNPLRSVDPFGLEEGSPANLEKRRQINNIAVGYQGSKAWAMDAKKDDFGKGTNKCNQFVYDVVTEAGAGGDAIEKGGWPPQAAAWANPKIDIANWRPLDKGESLQPGDVAAFKLSGGGTAFSGHSGIIILDSAGGLAAQSAHDNAVFATKGQFGENREKTPQPVTFRRYTGE